MFCELSRCQAGRVGRTALRGVEIKTNELSEHIHEGTSRRVYRSYQLYIRPVKDFLANSRVKFDFKRGVLVHSSMAHFYCQK